MAPIHENVGGESIFQFLTKMEKRIYWALIHKTGVAETSLLR